MYKLIQVIFSIALVNAHMQMVMPPPRNSQYLKGATNIDYNMLNPLNADGSNFPCKGYGPGPLAATYNAGQTIKVEIGGSATHGGGHCEFSISYNDKDFVALKTIIRNCFVGTGKTFDVTIPANAPACERCTFSWSWVNAIGNREFYQNCADIKIVNPSGSASLTGKKMNVHNLPGYPGIGEFPLPSQEDGASFYNSAPQITIGPGTATREQAGTFRAMSTDNKQDTISFPQNSQAKRQQSAPVPPSPAPAPEAPAPPSQNVPTSAPPAAEPQTAQRQGTSGQDQSIESLMEALISMLSRDDGDDKPMTQSATQQVPAAQEQSPRPETFAAPSAAPEGRCNTATDKQCCTGQQTYKVCASDRWQDMRCPDGTRCYDKNGKIACDY